MGAKLKPLALHCSDTHARPKREDEKHALRQIFDKAISLQLDIVGAGDLIDRQSNRSETITFFYKQLDRLQAAKKKFYFTQGQHDADDPPWLSAHPAAVHMHKDVVDFGEFVMYGLDWQPFGKLQEELAEIPKSCNMLICHQVWSNWMGDIAAPQGSFEQIPGHIRHVHTGDLHSWKLETKKNADGLKMQVLSCGATTQQTIIEPSEHHYALLYPDGRWEKRTLNSRVMIDSSLLTQESDVEVFMAELEPTLAEAEQKAAAMELPAEMYKPYLRVSYAHKLSDVPRRVEKAVAGRAILHFKELIPEEKVEAYKAAKKVEKGVAVTPISVLPQTVDKEERPGVYELTERLLLASDKEMEFAKWRSEYLGEDAASQGG